MKKEIEIAVGREVINSIKREIDFPEVAKYYAKTEEGRFFPRGLILFAIVPKYPNSINTYLLVQVQRGKQDYNDFEPSGDCKQAYWLKEEGVRKQAFDIITNPNGLDGFKEISEEEFETQRAELLDVYKRKD